MFMKDSARSIVVKGKHILLIKRNKLGARYYTLPGGRIEADETPEAAAIRETLEETTVKIKTPRLVFVEEAGNLFGRQYIFLCDYVSGKPALSPDSDEAKSTLSGKNTYQPLWLDIEKIGVTPLVSPILRRAVITALRDGFPTEPHHLSSS